jgi:hypothetical protein
MDDREDMPTKIWATGNSAAEDDERGETKGCTYLEDQKVERVLRLQCVVCGVRCV